MRILNLDTDKSVNEIILFLTPSEASELVAALQVILKKPSDHVHVSNEDFTKEVTVCIYDPKKLDHFDERSRKIILTGE